MNVSIPGTGVLPVDKPPGPTSHDVVSRARQALGIRKVGHTGTLDPFASGLLLLCVGSATRIAEYLKDLPKRYEAVARLGQATDTDDSRGVVIREDGGWRGLRPAEVEAALLAFRGTISQVPPQYSAKKVRGEAAHRRVRRGESVELAPVEVEVKQLELLSVDLPLVRFRILSSAGTYIRAVARDLGEALGVGAHLTGLRRTAVGSFGVADALRLEELNQPEAVDSAWVSPLDALSHLPVLEVEEEEARWLAQGRKISREEIEVVPPGVPVVLSRRGRLVAMGQALEGAIRPIKVFSA